MLFDSDQWKLGSFNQSGNPIIVRSRNGIPDESDRSKYSHLIVIKWPYSSAQAGMPDATTRERFIEFETALDSGLVAQGAGIEAVSLTGNGEKEWRYYTYDPQVFMDALQQDLGSHRPFPIELQLFQDPDWLGVTEFLNNDSPTS
ncbi:hypothetical protein J2S30_004543 [Herbaspirillum rubrisubalbicans]|uniref:DUF695 domain-containing protein n=1 Tax=Herbaspirillum rubrisubalbicans TaxID=80842 RepID=UPI0020A074D3|nr:hypothetical protein [Herbaspirillum rubrisubalbicans]